MNRRDWLKRMGLTGVMTLVAEISLEIGTTSTTKKVRWNWHPVFHVHWIPCLVRPRFWQIACVR